MTNDGIQPCYHCAGTGRTLRVDGTKPFDVAMTVYDRWETIRDLQNPPFVGQIAMLAGTGQRLLWDGEGWVGLIDD